MKNQKNSKLGYMLVLRRHSKNEIIQKKREEYVRSINISFAKNVNNR